VRGVVGLCEIDFMLVAGIDSCLMIRYRSVYCPKKVRSYSTCLGRNLIV